MHVEEVYFVCHIVFCSFLIQIHNTIIEFGASRLVRSTINLIMIMSTDNAPQKVMSIEVS